MKNITHAFQTLYEPQILLAIYQHEAPDQREKSTFVESFSFNQACQPVNRRPLTLADNQLLSNCVGAMKDNSLTFTECQDILPTNVLHIPQTSTGHLVWYTKPKKTYLLFEERTNIASAVYPVPALLWRANCREISIYALPDGKRPNEKTIIYHAPFFNVYNSGSVCMGTVSLKGLQHLRMEAFMKQWQHLFFGSRFSHTNFNDGVKGGMSKLWQSLKGAQPKFPVDKLKKANTNLKNLIA